MRKKREGEDSSLIDADAVTVSFTKEPPTVTVFVAGTIVIDGGPSVEWTGQLGELNADGG